MESERIENIRTFGDALANYIEAQNDTRLFNTFFYENKDYVLRKALINANKEYARQGHSPFLTFDLYVNAFGVEGEINLGDWYLVGTRPGTHSLDRAITRQRLAGRKRRRAPRSSPKQPEATEQPSNRGK